MSGSFKREEKKYRISSNQYESIMPVILSRLNFDEYCNDEKGYDVFNIYYDTDNSLVITKSIMKPKYKVKLRIRRYGNSDQYFLELKRKVKGTVYKRRITFNYDEYIDFINEGVFPLRENYVDNIIIGEIKSFMDLYPQIKPAMEISYNRVAYVNKKGEPYLRMTFDRFIRSRYVGEEEYRNVIDLGEYLVEIKVMKAIPLWLTKLLNENHIYPTSFSKYGKDYRARMKEVAHV